ncbi:protein LIGHT-DEPENDENT SHORT HYPOCOTYLS 6-like [Bidens hawaiensis]|uniref:protein LIGHT-DEPENDENT SHORT HYPOCOTYLS 6-like n=1 Tax=Bidens hawaiensis TaxID=980011 RepID=UPI00404A201E
MLFGVASTLSGSTFASPDSQPSSVQLISDETDKHLDWKMFLQYLKYQKPPVLFQNCNSDHAIEFLKYLHKFGDIKVHVQSCVLFGHPNQAVTCFCPLREAWGILGEIAMRLHHAYIKNKLPEMESLDIEDIQSYLMEVKISQENALGIPSMIEDNSSKYAVPLRSFANISSKKGESLFHLNLCL